MNPGFFTMEDVNKVLEFNNIFDAKNFVNEKINSFTNAKKYNIIKIKDIISNIKTQERLASAMTNYILAHPSENLKVV